MAPIRLLPEKPVPQARPRYKSYSCLVTRLVVGFFAVLFCCWSAFAQVGTGGTIVGTVTDQTGAAIPNAPITITDVDTNTVTRVSSNASGEYTAAGLPVGHYAVVCEVKGFKKFEQTNIPLNVGDRRSVDIGLQIGSTQETVVVQAEAVQVQSESGEVSDVITGQQVTQLATNGRSLYALTALIPGASSNMSDYQSPTPVGGNATVSFNGLRQAHNMYMIDGGEDYDRGSGGTISVMPSVDAIGEFRAMTSNYSAEYGLASGATMTMVFKSGTKDFHGELWEFFRNDAMDANNFFLNQAGKPAPELRQNIYGFNIGGPVFIPKVYNRNRDKTFFFYNMEWRKIVQGGSINQQVPLASQYGGNFGSTLGSNLANLHTPCVNQVSSAIASKFAAAHVTLSPCSGTNPYVAFPNNTIPASLLDPNAQALLNAGIFPAASTFNTANGVTTGNFVGGANAPTNVREEIVRVDHHFTDKFWVFGHWVDEQISQTYSPSQWNSDNLPTSRDVFGNPSYSGVVHATYSISPTLLNETAFNYNGNRISIVPIGTITQPSGFNVPQLFPGNNLNRIPTIQLSGGESATYDIGSWPWHNKADDYQVRDDLSWTKGNHQLKFGAAWMMYKKIQDLFGNTQGNFSFNGTYTGNGFADFLLGYANSYQELAIQDAGHWDSKSYDAYVQDTWKVTPRLTLNLGVRWDGIPHTYEENNRQSNFYPNLYNPAYAANINPANGNIVPGSPGLGTSSNPILAGYPLYMNGIGIAGQNGIPRGLVQNHWALFAPRLGFAYDLTGAGKTVLRGGFGIMYERVQGNDVYNAGPNVPFTLTSTLNNVLFSNPTVAIATGTAATAPITAPSITGFAYSDYKNPSSYQFSLGVQQQVGTSSVLSVEYVGNQNRHQSDTRNINLPPNNPSLLANIASGVTQYNAAVPYLGFNSIVLAENAENSYYNGLQVELKSQVRRDLTLQAAYTWSRAIDPATGANGNGNGASGDLAPASDPYNRAYDFGPSLLDRNQILVVNFIYQLPFFEGSNNLFLKSALGGWELSAIGTMESGLALNVSLGGTYGSNGIPNSSNRPNVIGGLNYPGTILQWFNTGIFQQPAPGTWGDAGKGLLRGPGRDNWDVSLFKRFVFSESGQRDVEFRFESFNTFNHTQFNNIDTGFSSGTFGHVTSVWDPRVLQLALKLHF